MANLVIKDKAQAKLHEPDKWRDKAEVQNKHSVDKDLLKKSKQILFPSMDKSR
jgi:hypothetical protein